MKYYRPVSLKWNHRAFLCSFHWIRRKNGWLLPFKKWGEKIFAFFEKNTEQIEKKLTKLLFDCCGINSLVVHGNSTQPQNSDLPDTGHAWNIVSFEKASYHLDITFDITVMTHSVERYDYFNLCDSEIAIDHMWDRHAVMSLLSQVHMVQ